MGSLKLDENFALVSLLSIILLKQQPTNGEDLQP
jgi:hypothetical protein